MSREDLKKLIFIFSLLPLVDLLVGILPYFIPKFVYVPYILAFPALIYWDRSPSSFELAVFAIIIALYFGFVFKLAYSISKTLSRYLVLSLIGMLILVVAGQSYQTIRYKNFLAEKNEELGYIVKQTAKAVTVHNIRLNTIPNNLNVYSTSFELIVKPSDFPKGYEKFVVKVGNKKNPGYFLSHPLEISDGNFTIGKIDAQQKDYFEINVEKTNNGISYSFRVYDNHIEDGNVLLTLRNESIGVQNSADVFTYDLTSELVKLRNDALELK